MKAIIIDDETKSREVLKILLKDYADIQVSGEAGDVKQAIRIIQEVNPDVIFLDIKLNAEEGFDVLDELPNRQFEIIFVTSYDNYALKAIKYAAFDYLLKPIDLDDLQKAILKLRNKKKEKQNDPTKSSVLSVHAGASVKMITPEEIYYIEADGAYSNIFTKDSSWSTAKTLKDIEDICSDYSKFIRINRGVVVNTSYIKEYSKGTYFSITMINDQVFEVSRRKKSEVLEKLNGK
jgi:two-component system, LytTR family, response regulator